MDNTKTEWQRGWENALESVWAYLHDYPNVGGDIKIMQEVERIVKDSIIEAFAKAFETSPASLTSSL